MARRQQPADDGTEQQRGRTHQQRRRVAGGERVLRAGHQRRALRPELAGDAEGAGDALLGGLCRGPRQAGRGQLPAVHRHQHAGRDGAAERAADLARHVVDGGRERPPVGREPVDDQLRARA
jgi:hypothetical protein